MSESSFSTSRPSGGESPDHVSRVKPVAEVQCVTELIPDQCEVTSRVARGAAAVFGPGDSRSGSGIGLYKRPCAHETIVSV